MHLLVGFSIAYSQILGEQPCGEKGGLPNVPKKDGRRTTGGMKKGAHDGQNKFSLYWRKCTYQVVVNR